MCVRARERKVSLSFGFKKIFFRDVKDKITVPSELDHFKKIISWLKNIMKISLKCDCLFIKIKFA